ncbi:Myb-like_DNA-binding domain-containing protein [Hexamita inflata]|uniref:Myb-like DNA-binding domain-containing protein n=1 Tax=Hexamita inflata TaxID=28002 RepID=A0AA86V1C9_9EUKA|nr:Myb-like DNA-binding domain-containing protein [Hexamita inflata]
MNKQKLLWKPEEIEKLTQLTQNSRDNHCDIKWKDIASQMQNRTELQCKSYYQNILKKKLTTSIRKNHVWNRIELLMLFTLVIKHNSDFTKIQLEMPNFTVQQLKSQWRMLKSKLAHYMDDYIRVLADPQYISQIDSQTLIQEQHLIRVGLVRQYLMQNEPETVYSKMYQMFWNKIEPKSVHEVFELEIQRRNIQTTVFTVTDPENQMMF